MLVNQPRVLAGRSELLSGASTPAAAGAMWGIEASETGWLTSTEKHVFSQLL